MHPFFALTLSYLLQMELLFVMSTLHLGILNLHYTRQSPLVVIW